MNRIAGCIADALDHMTADLLADKDLRRKESDLALRREVIEEVEKAIKRLDNVINGERYKQGGLEENWKKTPRVFRRKRDMIKGQIEACSTRIANCEEEKRRVLLNHGMTTVEEYELFKKAVVDLEMDVKQGAVEMDQAGMRGLFAAGKINMHSLRLIKLAHARLSSISDEDFVSLIPEIKKKFDDKKMEITSREDLSTEEKEYLLYGLSNYKRTLGYEERLRKIKKQL